MAGPSPSIRWLRGRESRLNWTLADSLTVRRHAMKFVFATILLLIPSLAAAEGTSVPYNMGGPHAAFDPVIAQYNQSGERFRIEGQCKSSCPMLLGIRNVCVDRNASFLFHGANDNS